MKRMGTRGKRRKMVDMISVEDFLEVTKEDMNSPTTSTFLEKIPHCRNLAIHVEEKLENDRGGLSKIKKSLQTINQSGTTFVESELDLSLVLKKLDTDEPKLESTYLKFSDLIKEHSNLKKTLMRNLQKVLLPLDSILKGVGDIRNVKGDLKRSFDQSLRDYEIRHLKLKKRQKTKEEEKDIEISKHEVAPDETERERRLLQLNLCEYMITVNDIKTKKNVELVKHLVEYYHALMSYFKDGQRTMEDFESYVNILSDNLVEIGQKQDYEKERLIEMRTLLRSSAVLEKENLNSSTTSMLPKRELRKRKPPRHLSSSPSRSPSKSVIGNSAFEKLEFVDEVDVQVKLEPTTESDPDYQPHEDDSHIQIQPKQLKRRKLTIKSHVSPRSRSRKRKLSIIYVCTEVDCSYEGDKKDEYLDHLLSAHGKSEVDLMQIGMVQGDAHACLICDSVYKSAEDLESHCSQKHIPFVKVRSHSCEDCGKKFVTKHDLKNHIITHSLAPTFACEQCTFVARRTQELERHIKCVHRKEKHFFCDVCNKGYPLKWQLNDHQRIHSTGRDFPCNHAGCDKSFRTPQNLRQHLELHKGAKYICDICGQSYSRKAYLRLHMNGTHLMLPLPPSQKRDRNPNIKRPSRAKSDSTTPKVKTKPKNKLPQQYKARQNKLIQPQHNQNPSEENMKDENMIVVSTPELHNIHSDDEGTLHVELTLDQQTGETLIVDNEGNTPSFPLSDQIICVPVGSLDMVQRYPITIAGSGNTFYITTAGQQENEGAISVYPFSELISVQQHPQ